MAHQEISDAYQSNDYPKLLNFLHSIPPIDFPPAHRTQIFTTVLATLDTIMFDQFFPLLFPNLPKTSPTTLSTYPYKINFETTDLFHDFVSAITHHLESNTALAPITTPASPFSYQIITPSILHIFNHLLQLYSHSTYILPSDYWFEFILSYNDVLTHDCTQDTIITNLFIPFLTSHPNGLSASITTLSQFFAPALYITIVQKIPNFHPELITKSNIPLFYHLCTYHPTHAVAILQHYYSSITFYEQVLVHSSEIIENHTTTSSQSILLPLSTTQSIFVMEKREYLSQLMNALTASDTNELISTLFRLCATTMISLVNEHNDKYLELEGYSPIQPREQGQPGHIAITSLESNISSRSNELNSKPKRTTGALGTKVNSSMYLRPISALCNNRASFVIEWIKQSLSHRQYIEQLSTSTNLTTPQSTSTTSLQLSPSSLDPTLSFSQFPSQSTSISLNLDIFSIPSNILNLCLSSIRPHSILLAQYLLKNATQLQLHVDLQVLLDSIYKSSTSTFALATCYYFLHFEKFATNAELPPENPSTQIQSQQTNENQDGITLNSTSPLAQNKLNILQFLLTAIITHHAVSTLNISKEIEKVFFDLNSKDLQYNTCLAIFKKYSLPLSFWPFYTIVDKNGEYCHILLLTVNKPRPTLGSGTRFRSRLAISISPTPPVAPLHSSITNTINTTNTTNTRIDCDISPNLLDQTIQYPSFSPITQRQLTALVKEHYINKSKEEMCTIVLNIICDIIASSE